MTGRIDKSTTGRRVVSRLGIAAKPRFEGGEGVPLLRRHPASPQRLQIAKRQILLFMLARAGT